MARVIAIFCICVLSNVLAQSNTVTFYAELERHYQDLIGAHLADGVCAAPSAEVIERQQALASAISSATPSTGARVLLFAVTANSLENVRRLNEAGASRKGDNGSLLHAAAVYADPPMLDYLTGVGFGIEEFGGASGPALMVAVASNRLDNAAWLIEHGADVNATDTGGGLVLRHALVCRDQATVDFLLEAGAVPDAKTLEIAEKLGLRY